MKLPHARHIAIMLLLLLTLQAEGKRDSLLWVGIRDVGISYQQGQRDSALVRARRLLLTAEEQQDHLAQACLHNVMAVCLDEQPTRREAMQEYMQCVAIGEQHGYLQKVAKNRSSLLFQTMMPAYGRLVILCRDYRQKDKSLQYARTGMAWIADCDDVRLRATAMESFAEVLMEHREYELVYEPMKQAAMDALQLNMPDMALMMATYLTQIEYSVLHRSPQDIPWVKVGEELLPEAKTERAKTAFLSVVNMTIAKDEEPEVAVTETSQDTVPPTTEQATTAPRDTVPPRVEYVLLRHERIGLVGGALALVLAAFAAYVVWQRQRRKKLRQQTERQVRTSYIEGMEQERSRLAKELHDGVSNQLLAVEMKLNTDGPTEQTLQLLNESREQVRRVSHGLMPPEFTHATLDEVIAHYVSELDESSRQDISFHMNPADADWSTLTEQQALEAYRIVQEAVGNALKHAGATTIAVGMQKTEQQATLIISDNGALKEPAGGSGIGLRTMQQRAEAIGARLEFQRNSYGNLVRLTL